MLPGQMIIVLDEEGYPISDVLVSEFGTSFNDRYTNAKGEVKVPANMIRGKKLQLYLLAEGYRPVHDVEIDLQEREVPSLIAKFYLIKEEEDVDLSISGVVEDPRARALKSVTVGLRIGGEAPVEIVTDSIGRFAFYESAEELRRRLGTDTVDMVLEIYQENFERVRRVFTVDLLDQQRNKYFYEVLKPDPIFLKIDPVSVLEDQYKPRVLNKSSHRISFDPENDGFWILNPSHAKGETYKIYIVNDYFQAAQAEFNIDNLEQSGYTYQMEEVNLMNVMLFKEVIAPGLGRWIYFQDRNSLKYPLHLTESILFWSAAVVGISFEVAAEVHYQEYQSLEATQENVERLKDLRESVTQKQDIARPFLYAALGYFSYNMIRSWCKGRKEFAGRENGMDDHLPIGKWPTIKISPNAAGGGLQYGLVWQF